MLILIRIALLTSLCAVTFGSVVQAQELQQGTYRGDTEYNTTVVVNIQGKRAWASIIANGCLGDVEGKLARNDAGQLYLVDDLYKESQCAIAIIPDSATSFQTEQGPECSYHHGAACDFNAYVRLQP